jgi:hypothetical protein
MHFTPAQDSACLAMYTPAVERTDRCRNFSPSAYSCNKTPSNFPEIACLTFRDTKARQPQIEKPRYLLWLTKLFSSFADCLQTLYVCEIHLLLPIFG